MRDLLGRGFSLLLLEQGQDFEARGDENLERSRQEFRAAVTFELEGGGEFGPGVVGVDRGVGFLRIVDELGVAALELLGGERGGRGLGGEELAARRPSPSASSASRPGRPRKRSRRWGPPRP